MRVYLSHSNRLIAVLAGGVAIIVLLAWHMYCTYALDEPLYIAAFSGDYGAVVDYLDRGADPNWRYDDGSTPLEATERNGYSDIVEVLKRAGAR